MKPITAKPVLDSPEILEWPPDDGPFLPNLDDPTSNLLQDVHGSISSLELVLSSEGNYHPALKDMWPLFLAKFKDRPLENWLYTTSPPVAVPQVEHQVLRVGNLRIPCRPQVVVASGKVIRQLEEKGYTEGQAEPLYTDRGSVILVKKGNPLGIRGVWDLGREGVRYVSPHPDLEPGAFGSYAGTIYGIAGNDPDPPAGMTAERLFDLLFNGASRTPCKWLAGPRIHHRDMPWSIACGRGDAGVILYHLGLYIAQTFPDRFELVPLGGTISEPRPLRGTVRDTRFVVRIKHPWTPRQVEAAEKLVETFLSDEFSKILERRGLNRPEGFVPLESRRA